MADLEKDLEKITAEFDAKINVAENQEQQTKEQKAQLLEQKAKAIRTAFGDASKKAEDKGETALAAYYYCKGEIEALEAMGKSATKFPFYRMSTEHYDNCDCDKCNSWNAFLYDYKPYSAIFLTAVGAIIRQEQIPQNLNEESLRSVLSRSHDDVIGRALKEAAKYISSGKSIAEVLFRSSRLNSAHEIIIRAYKEDASLLRILLPVEYSGLISKFKEAEKIKAELQELKTKAENVQSLVDVSEILAAIETIKKEKIAPNPYTVYVAGITDEDLEAPKKILAEKTKL